MLNENNVINTQFTKRRPSEIIASGGSTCFCIFGLIETWKLFSLGHPASLFQFNITKDITVMTTCGLGGSSLTDEGVSLDCKSKVFYDPVWPQVFREDLDGLQTADRSHAQEMLRPCPYPDDYPPLKRMNQMRNAINNINMIDVEDIHETFYRTPLNINFTDLPTNHVGVSQPACNGCGNCLAGCNTGAKNTLLTNYIQDAVNHGAEVFTGVCMFFDDYRNIFCDW